MLHSKRFQKRTPRGCWLVLILGVLLVAPGAGPQTAGRQAPAAQGEQRPSGDLYGDPLTHGADLRLGTVRFRHSSVKSSCDTSRFRRTGRRP